MKAKYLYPLVLFIALWLIWQYGIGYGKTRVPPMNDQLLETLDSKHNINNFYRSQYYLNMMKNK